MVSNRRGDITVIYATYLSFSVFGSGHFPTDSHFEERLLLNPLYERKSYTAYTNFDGIGDFFKSSDDYLIWAHARARLSLYGTCTPGTASEHQLPKDAYLSLSS
jgi:hypothetical protein